MRPNGICMESAKTNVSKRADTICLDESTEGEELNIRPENHCRGYRGPHVELQTSLIKLVPMIRLDCPTIGDSSMTK